MTGSVSVQQLQSAIGEIDVRLMREPLDAGLYVDRGSFLELLGRKDEAVTAYVDALRVDPVYVDALVALGLLTLAAGNGGGARTLLQGAVLHGPEHAAAHANLAYALALDDQLDTARGMYERALELEPALAIAHHGLAQVCHRLGDEPSALHHRHLGLLHRPLTIERFVGDGEPIRVLAIGTEVQGNIPTFGYFDNRQFLLASLTIEHADIDMPLPPHDIVFNAIGEADRCPDQLAKAATLLRRTPVATINHPDDVRLTTRVGNARRLAELDGVRTAKMARVARPLLAGSQCAQTLAEHGLHFPLLVRSPGYHTGDHFVKVECAADLADAIEVLPGDELFVIEFLDVRDIVGDVRKYRAIIVDGRLYPLHLAISRWWKVHYFSADMIERPDHRAEDAAYLEDMPGVLGATVMATLERIRETLRLDFGGIDFTVDPGGDVVVFEANASMVVPPPDKDAIWDYRRKPVARIRAAVRDMLVRRSRPPVACIGTIG